MYHSSMTGPQKEGYANIRFAGLRAKLEKGR
jgi:hypothetical protein